MDLKAESYENFSNNFPEVEKSIGVVSLGQLVLGAGDQVT